MKRRLIIISLLILLLASLWMPFFTVYPHSALPLDIAVAFPGDVSGWQLIQQGTELLPVGLMPALGYIPFRESLLAIAIALTLIGGICALFEKRAVRYLSVLSGSVGMMLIYLYSSYLQQLDQSTLFSVMISVKWYIWIGVALTIGLFGIELWQLRKVEPLQIDDQRWRHISAMLSAIALLTLLLPYASTYVSAGTFATTQADALASRTVYGWQWLAVQEPMLQQEVAAQEISAEPTSGGAIRELISLSNSGTDVRNLFQIKTYNGTTRTIAIAGMGLLLIGMILQLIRKVDRWFPTGLIVLGSVLFAQAAISTLTVDSQYQFYGATSQLMFLGLGGYTVMPLITVSIAFCSAISAVWSIRRADVPYFQNPIPKRKRLVTVSILLAATGIVLLLLPIFQINLYTPGKVNQANPTVSKAMSGVVLMTFQQPTELMNPMNARGKALYTEATAKNGLTLMDMNRMVSGALQQISLLTVAITLVAVAGLGMLLLHKKHKRLMITTFLLGAVLQVITVILATTSLPKDVGYVSGLGPIYAAIGLSVFAAFFTGFYDYEELPKKYKLFLMMLPFLVAVLLFAYLPLSGWRYAFYNYKLGLPMDKQEFVGFKWFVSLFSNPAQSAETVRVLRNTFAMSGIGLFTSWMPVAFAIFLTEIKTGWFKKFVQIFTTLPNFISWVLVFSFALTIFSLDTGIVNKMLLSLGLIHEPIAYLNSGEQIWIKMWLWNTWKTLGWGAIMYLAAIAGIDQELYEASKVDGAGRWRQILHITIPGILPTFFVLLLLSISNVVNNGMEQYLVFQNAMNKSTIEVLDLYVFNISLGTRSTNTISMATAIGILKSLVSIVLLFLANRLSKSVRGESIV